MNNHDLFLITKSPDSGRDSLTHLQVGETGMPSQLSIDVRRDYPGYRKVMKLAQPHGPDKMRGAGFTILPNRPDPDMSQMCCFLINPRNLRDANPWNATEWSESEDGKDNSLTIENSPEFAKADFEVLLAGPAGKVYYAARCGDGDPTIKQLSDEELSQESELWVQLRNGLVAGCVAFHGHSTPDSIVATLNITSVMPRAGG